MRIALVGPGRAGLAVAIAANGAGHEIVAIAARDVEQATVAARRFDAVPLAIGEPIPPVDLVIIAVRDDAIETVAGQIAPIARNAVAGAVHLSGAVSIGALSSFADQDIAVGSIHPLQTLPTPTLGARRLAGSWMAVTADEPLRATLHEFAATIACHSFDLEDGDRATYHAAAAAVANFPIAAFAIAQRLFESTGVPFESARPLVDAVVANAFEFGPLASLTGPIARGDAGTVAAQIDAVRGAAPDLASAFEAMVDATSAVAGLIAKEDAR
jgi:predicted short-subunit dehydrogenase-like oxidoreductase (DUF2520 family)